MNARLPAVCIASLGVILWSSCHLWMTSPISEELACDEAFVHSRYNHLSVYHQGYTSAQVCRLELEEWQNILIDESFEMGKDMPPLVDWVWDMGHYFLINIKFHRLLRDTRRAFLNATWRWEDQFGSQYPVTEILGKELAMITTNFPSNHQICTLMRIDVPAFNNGGNRSMPVFLLVSKSEFPESMTVQPWVYDLQPFLNCDRIERSLERPRDAAKIGMCVRYRGNHELVAPFLAYHRLIGVDHFWFFANEPFDLTDLPYSPDVTYVPYRFVFQDHIHKIPERRDDEMLTFQDLTADQRDSFWQQEAQQQCLYRAKRAKLDWIMTNDVDEYLWVSKFESMKSTVLNGTRHVLKAFLREFELDPTIGGLVVEGWAFGSNTTEKHDLVVDYVHRMMRPGGGRRKLIYRVPIATRIGVHWLLEGGDEVEIPISDIRWNHYRTPEAGIYDRDNSVPVVMDTSLPDAYHALMLESMKHDQYPWKKSDRATHHVGSMRHSPKAHCLKVHY